MVTICLRLLAVKVEISLLFASRGRRTRAEKHTFRYILISLSNLLLTDYHDSSLSNFMLNFWFLLVSRDCSRSLAFILIKKPTSGTILSFYSFFSCSYLIPSKPSFRFLFTNSRYSSGLLSDMSSSIFHMFSAILRSF